jgi:hypothetical protein
MPCSSLAQSNFRRDHPMRMWACSHNVRPLISQESLPTSGESSRPEGLDKRRAFLGLASLLIGIHLYSSCALANVEENADQDESNNTFLLSTLSRQLTTNFLINNYDNITADDVAKYLLNIDDYSNAAKSRDHEPGVPAGSHRKSAHPTGPNDSDAALIPAAVWSLDSSTGIHLDHMSPALGSEMYTDRSHQSKSHFFWSRNNLDPWSNDPDGANPDLVTTPQVLQVANCGDMSAEHSDLDFCSDYKVKTNQQENNPNQSIIKNKNNSFLETNINSTLSNESASTLSTTPTPLSTGAIVPPSNAVSFGNYLPQADLTFSIPCDSVSAPCFLTQIEKPATLTSTPVSGSLTTIGDDSRPPIDLSPPEVLPPVILPPEVLPPDVLAPGQIVFVDNPGLDSDLPPVFNPPSVGSVPETSTWIMTILGFGALASIYGKRNNFLTRQVGTMNKYRKYWRWKN